MFGKSSSLVKGLIALTALLLGTSFAQDTQTANVTIAVANTLSVDTTTTLDFTPAVGTADTASDTLSFGSNDGDTYDVVVSASAWTQGVDDNATTVWPVLSFVDSTAVTGGAAVATGVDLISSANAAQSNVAVVTGVTNASGGATVNYSVSVTQAVVAGGSYNSTLTYTLLEDTTP